MDCSLCGSSSFRTSRLHFVDLPRLIYLQYPVRCLDCEERQYTNVFNTVKLRSAARARRLARHKRKLAKMEIMKFKPRKSRRHTSLLHR